MTTNSDLGRWRRIVLGPLAALLLAVTVGGGQVTPRSVDPADKKPAEPPKKAEVYKVPYQLSETQHIVVRAKINGKGPFNFVLDTGAPALFLSTEAAKKLEVKPDDKGWGTFDNFEIEGGIKMEKVKGRIEDPFQLIGMNQMNLPGIRYDGLMGYTILAQFKIQYDFTEPHLVWTRIDWKPPAPAGLAELGGKPPKDLDVMGGLMKFAAALLGRRPDPEIVTRGFLGVEIVDGATDVFITKVVADSPADKAGLKEMDRLKKFQGKVAESVENLQKLAAQHAGAEEIELEVERDGKTITATLKTMKGL